MYTKIDLVIKNNYIIGKKIQLSTITNCVCSKKITYRLQGSKGNISNQVNQLIDEINNISSEIGKMLKDTTISVSNIPIMFDKADNDMSNIIKKLG